MAGNYRLFRDCGARWLYDQSDSYDVKAMNDRFDELAEQAGVNKHAFGLVAYILMCEPLKRKYERYGYPEAVFNETVRDLKYKNGECLMLNGYSGCECCRWQSLFFELRGFGIGRLQFERVKLGESCICDGVSISEGTPAISVHIPRTGTKLDYKEVRAAYEASKKFFLKYFPEEYGSNTVVFTCCSWLLYPFNLTFLSENSHIRAFCEDYEVVSVKEGTGYKEVERVFECHYNGDPSSLKRDNSMRRAYAERIERGEPLGWANGVFLL